MIQKEIRDDEIRIIGYPVTTQKEKTKKKRRWMWWIAVGLIALVLVGLVLLTMIPKGEPIEQGTYSGQNAQATGTHDNTEKLGHETKQETKGYIELQDTTINEIPLLLFIPHNASMSLHVGPLDLQDTTVIFAAQAASVRKDNMAILGAFVLKGEPLAWGKSMKGYCACIDNVVTVGVAENTSLFEKATERGGYFFRQYPLVQDGKLVENNPKNKSIRRAICDRNGEIFMLESQTKESLHDFAQALVDLGVSQAVNLIGSDAYGWAVDMNGKRHDIGDIKYYTENYEMPENTSYLIWK